MSALFSGLTLGLMSWEVQELRRKAEAGDEEAARVLPVREDGNLLLTTLLIGNVAVNSTLSIFLGSMLTGIVATVLSTALIVIFGEIIPQAVFNRHGLQFGARVTWVVHILLFVFYPVAKPIAWALDKALGDELPTIYSKQELMKLIEDHEDAHIPTIDADEERIIKGALTFSDKRVRDVMTPRSVTHAFDTTDSITDELLADIRTSGVSRFPVFNNDTDEVVGILYASALIGYVPKAEMVKDVMDTDVRSVRDMAPLDSALQQFLSTRKHLATVEDEFGSVVGVVTLEDILEEIIKKEIVDERDTHPDMRAFAREEAQA